MLKTKRVQKEASLLDKQVFVEAIAKILNVSPTVVKNIIKKKSKRSFELEILSLRQQ